MHCTIKLVCVHTLLASMLLARISAFPQAIADSISYSDECIQSVTGQRVDSLPYFVHGETGDLPCMYAGNLKSSDVYDNHFFYWLFPQTDSSADTPLILYMNGGPGSTSMNALFTENGPLRVAQVDPEDQDSYQVTYEPQLSWQQAGDLLFVDQPVGTGWSYGEKSA